MHLYTVIAAPFVAQLMMASSPSDPTVKTHSAYIQAAFLIGWALGGEHLTVLTWVALAIIMGGVVIVNNEYARMANRME